MNPRLVVHIGYHKTGSTWLQEQVFAPHPGIHLAERLRAQELFLRCGGLGFDPEAVAAWRAEQLRAAEKCGATAVVVSDEELSGHLHSGGGGGYVSAAAAERIAEHLRPDALVVVVREQAAMVESAYRQYVAMGGTMSLRRYLAGDGGLPHRHPQFSLEHLCYDRLIARYRALLGVDRVHVLFYEDLRQEPERFRAAWAQLLGVDPTSMDRFAATPGANRSLSNPSLWLLRQAARFNGADPLGRDVILRCPWAFRAVRRVLRGVDAWVRLPRRGLLDERRRSQIRASCAESNRRLQAMIDRDLAAVGYAVTESAV